MKSLKIFLIITNLILFVGCTEFLDILPETELTLAEFFQSESDFVQAVNAAYAPMRQIVNSHAWVLCEMRSDNTIYLRNILFGATDQFEDISDHSLPEADGVVSNVHVLNQWRLSYLIISRTNQILDAIDQVDFNQNSKNNIKGQALFLRAYSYYELVRYFNRVPLHLKPVSTRSEAALPLSNPEDIYAQIITDVDEAIRLLPQRSQQQLGRVTSGAARMLLADVYITLNRWADAERLLKEIVDSGQYSLIPKYENVFSENISNKNNAESIFEVQFLEGPDGMSGNFLYNFMPRPMRANELVTITRTINPQPLDGQGNNIPTPNIISAFEDGDLRKDVSIDYIFLSTALHENKLFPYIKKFAKPHAQHNNHGMNWPIYRYAEALLFLAESLNEQGKSGEAAQFLNQVRNRAGLENTTAISQADLREAIFKERRVELAFENKRWHDLTRTNRYRDIISAHGTFAIANPQLYYFPEGAGFRSNAYTRITKFYALPAEESEISPHF